MTINRIWPDYLKDIWAKSAEQGAGGRPEELAQHTWSVLEKLAATIRLRPTLPKQIGMSRLWHILFWSAFLHDFGKAAKGFQARLRRGPKWPHRHEVLSLAFVDWVRSAFTADELQWLVAAVVSHHRDAAAIQQAYPLLTRPESDFRSELDDKTMGLLWDWLNECPASWIEALDLGNAGVDLLSLPPRNDAIRVVFEEGTERIRHWLNTYQRWLDKTVNRSGAMPLLIGTILLRGHLISSDHMASAHVGELPRPELDSADRLMGKLKLANLYAHQCACREARGSTVLMAPTGSGKTEAALLWAVSQNAPRLYYTLPFQASMNAMAKRLAEDDKDRQAPFKGQVGLEHSRSALAYYRRLLIEDETADVKKATRAAFWLKNLAELNYYPVRVLSPYQLLKAPYRLRGYETLLTDCFGAAFVFDEIHAYEAERLAKILALVKYLREHFNARFLVMSATLPTLLRDRLGEALGDYTLITATDDLYRQFRRHKLVLQDGDLLTDIQLNRIAEEALGGRSILVCCNTVARAQEAWNLLKQQLGEESVMLLHSRFNGRDRLSKEESVREKTGVRSDKRQPIVLVATQVVEVSLDIDLDVIYSDPAPLEALLQRFGRINRQRLKDFAPVCVFREPIPDKPRPYEPRLIRAALSVLEKHKDDMLDEALVSVWLDEVYARPEIAEPWQSDYQSAYTWFCDGPLANLRAFQSDDDLEEVFYEAFDSIEVLPEGMYSDYLLARDESPLKASELLVPISWQQYGRLKAEGRARVDEQGKLKLVDVYYDSLIGLDFNRKTEDASSDVWDSD